jgi:hypothetical protein
VKHSNQQLPDGQSNISTKGIIYVSPPIEQIKKCAKQICQSLGQTIDRKYDTSDTHSGLTAFLKIVADMEANSLNKREAQETLPNQKSKGFH